MKLKKIPIPVYMLAVSALGGFLHSLLYMTGLDDKGLLIPGQPAQLLLWLVTAGAVVLAVLYSRQSPMPQNRKLHAVACWLLAVCILADIFLGLAEVRTRLGWLTQIAGILCCAGLIWAGACQFTGKPVFFLAHGAVCLYFALRLMSSYHNWSGTPRILDYVFSMFSLVFLALFAYHRTAADVGMGKPRMQRLCAMRALYCTFVGSPMSIAPSSLAAALWVFTDPQE